MVGSVGSSAASQLLASLLKQLSSASSTSSSSSSSSTATASVSGFQQALPGDTKKSLTPPPTPTLNGDILSALIALQAQTGTNAQSSASGDASSPVQQLFSAMDSDGDGEVSQGEIESYIEKRGGTQAQADALYNSLDQGNSSGGISEDQMQTAVTNARQSFQAHHHRHHHGTGDPQSGDNVANSLLQALDTNDDGSISESEFSDFFSANGGSASDAQNTFAALDTSGSGALTSADFAKAWNAYQAQQGAQSSGNMMISMLDKLGQAASVTA
ncbi:MAG TPA: EF-hand domain-containing protein [Rhizomicrobium sp.]